MSKPAPIAFKEVGDFLRETGCSMHLRWDEPSRRFVVIAHLASEHRASDITSSDLDHAIKTVMVDF